MPGALDGLATCTGTVVAWPGGTVTDREVEPPATPSFITDSERFSSMSWNRVEGLRPSGAAVPVRGVTSIRFLFSLAISGDASLIEVDAVSPVEAVTEKKHCPSV